MVIHTIERSVAFLPLPKDRGFLRHIEVILLSKLDDAIKKLNKNHGQEIITTDKDAVAFEVKDRVPFPTPALTYLFGGGMPTETLWEISGNFSSGKSSICEAIAGEFQRYYKAKWESRVAELESIEKPTKAEATELATLKEEGHKRVLWLDAEQSMKDISWVKKNKLDPDDIVYIRPDEQSAEELLDDVIKLVETGGVCLVVIDSLASLTSASALKKDLTEKTYCGISGPLTTFTSKILPLLTAKGCTCICINQERDVLNAMFPTTNTPGGRAFKFGCHVRLSFRKGKGLDEKLSEIPNNSESFYGQLAEVSVIKNKATPPKNRLAKFTITYDNGVFGENDTVNLAIALNIINQSGAWFSYVDENGEVGANNLKWQGKPNVLNYVLEHKDFYNELKRRVEEQILQ